MTELVGNWLHFTARQPKRKRAELVCHFCHSKKVKCDLQSRTTQGHARCSTCDGQDRDCQLRPSKRGKQRRRLSNQDGDTINVLPAVDAIDSELPTNGIDDAISSGPSPTLVDGPQSAPEASLYEARSEPRPLPQTQASTSPTEGAGRSHAGDVDTGFLQVYGPENQFDAEQQEFVASLDTGTQKSDPRQRELLQSFSETYFEYCYPWCPVLDRQTLPDDLEKSPMLTSALALAASHIQPPLVRHEGPAACYDKARTIFYNDEEADALTALKSVALFYWWAPRPPSTAHRHSSWWWTSVIIRHAQQMNIHREPAEGNPQRNELDLSLRRRIWWTVFVSQVAQLEEELLAANYLKARERLTSLCQSKPCIIDPDDMNIQETQLSDFPSDPRSQKQGLIFIHWVRLCGVIGKISKVLSRSASSNMHPFPVLLRQELVDWVTDLPIELQLPISSETTESFDRDVHQLHLPYLTTVIILHLQKSASGLPQALPPALLAASCIARILRDILSRGNARFLMAITCWYCGTAFIALLQASRIAQLAKEAEEGLDILEQAVGQLQHMWASANVIRQGFERLRKLPQTMVRLPETRASEQTVLLDEEPCGIGNNVHDSTNIYHGFDWTALFPFVTRSTSQIAQFLLADKEFGAPATSLNSPQNAMFQEELLDHYHDLLEPFFPEFSLVSMNFSEL